MCATSRAFRAFFVPVVAVLVAACIEWLFAPLTGHNASFLALTLAVTAGAWYGGFWGGMLSTVIGAAVGTFLLLEPLYSFRMTPPGGGRICEFILAGCTVTVLVTRRKRQADTAVQGQRWYRTLLETSEEGVWVVDQNQRTLFVNDKMASLLGYTAASMVGQPIHAFLGADEARASIRAKGERRRAGIREQYEIHVTCKDGSDLHALVSASPLFDENGGFAGSLAMVTDVTERHHIAETLRESELRYRTLTEAFPQAVWTSTPQGAIDYVNRHYLEFTGTDAKVALGAGWERAVHADDLPRVAAAWRNSLETGTPLNVEYRMRRADGVHRWHCVRGVPMAGADGNVVRWIGTAVDVDDRKRAEAVHARLAAIVQSSDDAIISEALDGRILSWNAAAERIFGYAADDVLGRSLAILSPPERPDEWSQMLDRIKRGLHVEHFETVRVRRDGRRINVSIALSPLLDPDGTVVGASKIARDITEHSVMEEQLRAAHGRLQRLVDANIVGIVVGDASGRILESNDYFLNLLGFSRQELEAGTFRWDTVTPLEFHPLDRGALAEVRERGVCTPYEKEYLRRDGTRVPVMIIDAALLGPGDQVIAVVLDMTVQKRVEQALRESETRYRLVARASNDVFWEWDLRTGEVTWADSLVDAFGYPPEEREGGESWWSDRIHPDDRDRVNAALKETWTSRTDFWTKEYRFRRRDGSYAWVLDRGCVQRGADGSPLRMFGAMQDCTDRKRASELEVERNGLRGAVKALDRVLGVVGHELRTPLAATRAMTELLLMQGVQRAVDAEETVETVHSEIVRMSTLVNDLLEVARLNSGTAQWNWGVVDVATACADAIECATPLTDPTHVSLVLHVAREGLSMLGDGDALRRLVLNLLTNAIRHTTEGFVEVRVDDVQDGPLSLIKLAVRDTGAGMAPATVEKLGEPFALNAGVVGADHIRGSGLGLAICKGIVEAHGGRITVTSVQGRGTTMTVLLRADLAEPEQGSQTLRIIQGST